MGIIRLKNMTFYGYHGVYDFEKEKGTDFEIDLELFTPLLKSSKSDNIEDTINYEDIYELVKKVFGSKSYFLLEKLADSISMSIFKEHKIDKLIIRVRKINAPLNGKLDSVEIELKREKSDYV
ncbi:MAG: dihydroneopterin aldolase [Candidatus Marinimicrobia bacterium]|nr:dihydroneopterin aldolase [Candidatus Neomarinimicrobiota bacterium]